MPAKGQLYDSCRINYDGLRKAISMGNEIAEAATLRVLLSEEEAKAARKESLFFREYLRPAGRKEIKSGVVQGFPQEYVAPDSNVYVVSKVPDEQFFFATEEDSQEGFDLLQIAGQPMVPIGLKPHSLSEKARERLLLMEQRATYWLFLADEKLLVFYPQSIEVDQFLGTPVDPQMMARRISIQQNLVGQQLVMPGKEVAAGRSIVAVEEDDEGYLVLGVENGGSNTLRSELVHYRMDDDSNFEIYNRGCINQINVRVKEAQEKRIAGMENYFNALAKGEIPIQSMLSQPAYLTIINDRFQLMSDLSGRLSWYIHLEQIPGTVQDQSFVQANLNNTGEMHLQSTLLVPEGFRHVRVEAKIGDKVWKSHTVPFYDGRSQPLRIGNQMQENIRYTRLDNRALIEAIAANAERDIDIHFINASGQRIVKPLPKAHRMAIRDTWIMYLWLSAQG